MNALLKRVFVEHPHSVDESYIQHMRFAMGFAGQLFVAGGMALVHAFIPCLFEKTASVRIQAIHARLQHRD